MVDFSRLVLRPAMQAFGRSFAIVFKPAGGGEHPVRGIFDREFLEVPMEDGETHVSTSARLGIRLDEWPQFPVQKDRVTVNGEVFLIFRAEPDGQGGMTLLLRKVSA